MTKRDLALLAALYGAWLVCAYLINAATTGARTPADILHEWIRFDGIYFRAIAEFGYDEASRIIRWQQGFPFLTAAFPLFPLLIHLVVPFFAGDYTLASVVVPQTLTFLVLAALFRLVRLDFSRTAAWLSTLSLLTFPTFYFLLAPYSETLFLLLVILSFHEYRTGRLWRAGLLGALASAARIVGAPLLLGTFVLDILYGAWHAGHISWPAGNGAQREGQAVEHTASSAASAFIPARPALDGVPHSSLRLHPRSPRARRGSALFSLSLIPLGFLIYMLYQWLDFGNPLLFLRGHASSEWKVGFDLLGPVRGLLLPFYTVLARDWTTDIFRTNMFNSLFFYFGSVMTVYAWRRLPALYALYSLLAVVAPTLSGSLISMPRFLLIAFPIFIGMGVLLEAHPRLRLLPVLLALAGLLAMRLFFQTVFLG